MNRGDIAHRFAVRSLDMDGGQYARGRQFNLALSAVAHAQMGEIEEACRLGIEAADAAEGLSSMRARDYLMDIANRLSRHAGLSAVEAYSERIRPIMSGA